MTPWYLDGRRSRRPDVPGDLPRHRGRTARVAPPRLSETPAVGVLVGAGVVAVLRLPLSAIVMALIVSQAGAGVAPLIILGVVVTYIAMELIAACRTSATSRPNAEAETESGSA
jgi:hypothetical protein